MSYKPTYNDPETSLLPLTRYRVELVDVSGAQRRWPVGQPGSLRMPNVWTEDQTFNKQIVSLLPDGGVMPINVTSLVKCDKLNADMVDGIHAATIAQAAAGLTDNALLRGDGGASGLQDSGWLLDDNDDMLVPGAKKLLFRNDDLWIHASDDEQLTLNALTDIRFSITDATAVILSATGLDVVDQVGAANFVSDVATGTQSYAGTSTTKNTNLHADLLDGLHVGTSGNVLGALDATNTWTGVQTFGTTTKLQFYGPDNYINTLAPTVLQINAGSAMLWLIGGGTQATLGSTGLTLVNLCKANNFQSTVATGTAPIVVASETEVAKLNVARLQGNAASAFASASHTHFTVSTTEVFSGTSPTVMTNLDLSATVGSNIALVALSFKSASDMNAVSVRTDGDANDYYSEMSDANAYGSQLGHHGADADLVLIVATNASGVIEWRTETAQTCTVDVLWFMP